MTNNAQLPTLATFREKHNTLKRIHGQDSITVNTISSAKEAGHLRDAGAAERTAGVPMSKQEDSDASSRTMNATTARR
eukprot:CAMPEP_0184320410 /NCGR_PEP_ID=MMETSP1049-20130417/113877_1 /TAXON_ID=77928 /ORGANISM="Proteomonas sulcata, Strain CCMP704" /LENGTH=77 /DNA_ID=CAMNT_0026640905 /DNA_START=239 /DNA_END=472 /DNA_ORIENTATION=+